MVSVVQGKVINHGSAPYKHDPDNQQSYFVELAGSNNDTRVLWGMGIRDAIQLQNIKTGEEVAFYDKGLADGSKKRNWDVERVERLKDYPNSIENGTELDISKKDTTDGKSISDPNHPLGRERYKVEEDEQEIDLPSSVKNQYIIKVSNRFLQNEKVNFYDRDSQDGLIAFEDRSNSLHTSNEDKKTIKAMLDVAQAKNWSAIKLKGTEAFKREAWLEASTRGVEVKGYTPTEKDLVELEKRKAERSTNKIVGDENRSQELNSKREERSNLYTKEEDKNLNDHVKDASTAVAIDASLAVATGGKYTASMVATSIIADKAQSLAFDKLDEKYKLSEKVSGMKTDKESEVWDAEVLAEEYNLPKDKAEALFIGHPSKVDLEEHIASMQDEYNVDRESSIEGLANMAMDGKYNDPDLDDKAWEQQLAGWEQQDEKEIQKYEAQHELNKQIEQETLIRSNEFDAGRDVDYSGGSEIEAEVENFHDNLAVPTGVNGISKAEATRQTEASFDRKINNTQRNEVLEDMETNLSNKDKLVIEAWRRAVDFRFKDDPAKRQEKHDALNAKIPDILEGKYQLEPPTISQQPEIEVATRNIGSQDRVR